MANVSTNEVPNADTIEIINELEEFKKNPNGYQKYSSFSKLLSEVCEDT